MISGTSPEYEAIVVGAGVTGIYQIKLLGDLGIKSILLEAADDLGGTWYRNRYPGCRFDSESHTYAYSFSKELLNEWQWKERFAGQPETLRYLNFVADKFDLRRRMLFNSKVSSMRFDAESNHWELTLHNGRVLTSRFVVMALGILSAPTCPSIEGREAFRGQSFHTYYWPERAVDLVDKSVAVIGTGATAIQLIPEIAKKAAKLTVFQRRPNWACPLNNGPISEAEMSDIRAHYDEIFATCARTLSGFVHEFDPRGFYEVSPEERVKLWDRLYQTPGFAIWLRNFKEILTDPAANAELSEYIANRIRQRVRDPAIAEKLIPRDHGFAVQRLPMETGYYETYNRDNVQLVDINDTPIQRITERGLKTTEREFEFDVIVYATGFDAITGSFDRIEIQGMSGVRLADKWKDGPATFLGFMTNGFPNFLMPTGPQSGSASTNFPRAIETGVGWCTRLIQHMRANGYLNANPTRDAERDWTEHVKAMYSMMLMRNAKSWFTGYNSNVAGHEHGKTRYFVYNGGAPRFVSKIKGVEMNDYRGIEFDGGAHVPRVAGPPALRRA